MQQTQGDIHKVGPFSREVKMQNALNHLEDLLAGGAIGAGEDGKDAVAEPLLLIFGYQLLIGIVIALGPATVCSVL